ncbi:hypothetical protein X808_8650 [Mannheimia varigena USDA-ARS-USMARC-1296]|uniref:DUF2513 domain-containing protein n=1 Tax=Mannheimia varigena USDA-ARS-USMARC-1296 TaxID=1433287 RepID=W0QDT9_9PAST|nr:DUF2513 domain-containing protein [Mannheimia varigena]AHG75388.1 hypothetical protein X808_8650 [Mannheimia varigena USDA-ARS-USMARC-1296]
MKRNWDLIRKILLKLEEKADSISWLESTDIKGYDAKTVAYHYKLLSNAGLIEAIDVSSLEEEDFSATSLTWQGHEFLDKIRNDSVWNKVKSTVQSKSLDLSFDVIKTVATKIIAAMI